MIRISIPVRTINASNVSEHHFAKARRVKKEREIVSLFMRQVKFPDPPMRITLIRVGGQQLDSDGLVRSCKAPRDQIAAEIGIDDKHDNLVKWEYEQRPGKSTGKKGVPMDISLEVTIEPLTEA